MAGVPIGYYIRTSAGEDSTISNILVIIEHNQSCSKLSVIKFKLLNYFLEAFGYDKPIVVVPAMNAALVNAFKELKERKVELVSKRELAVCTEC